MALHHRIFCSCFNLKVVLCKSLAGELELKILATRK